MIVVDISMEKRGHTSFEGQVEANKHPDKPTQLIISPLTYSLLYFFVLAENAGTDQPGQMPRLISAFIVCISS